MTVSMKHILQAMIAFAAYFALSNISKVLRDTQIWIPQQNETNNIPIPEVRFQNYSRNASFTRTASLSLPPQKSSATSRPPLNQLLNNKQIVGNVSFLLDFAILGFPKTGTTTLMSYLKTNSSHIFQKEHCELAFNQPWKVVRDLYQNLPPDHDIVRGLKCPWLILEGFKRFRYNHQTYFPNAKMIIGVRHPIKWFESYYNYRIQEDWELPSPEKLTGHCGRSKNWKMTGGVCTGGGVFHRHLANFGKTSLENEERKLFEPPHVSIHDFQALPAKMPPFPGKIFIYDLVQLSDKNQTRALRFRQDLQQFLEIKQDLPPMIYVKPDKIVSTEEQKQKNEKKIDICDAGHSDIHSNLGNISKSASKWILEYFLKSPDVFVSSRYYFEHLLEEWTRDPCKNNQK